MVTLPNKNTRDDNGKKRKLKSIKRDDSALQDDQDGLNPQDDLGTPDDTGADENVDLNDMGESDLSNDEQKQEEKPKKKRRRRRKKKKKPVDSDESIEKVEDELQDDFMADEDFSEMQDNFGDDVTDESEEPLKPKKKKRNKKKKKKVVEETEEDVFDEFGDEAIDETEVEPEEKEIKPKKKKRRRKKKKKVDIIEEPVLDESDQFTDEDVLNDEDTGIIDEENETDEMTQTSDQKKGDSVWDKYDGTDSQVPEAETKTPVDTPKTEEADVPDWLKGVPEQQWDEPVIGDDFLKDKANDDVSTGEFDEQPYEGIHNNEDEQKTEQQPEVMHGEITDAEGNEIIDEQPHALEDDRGKKTYFLDKLNELLAQAGISIKGLIIWIVVIVMLVFGVYYVIGHIGDWFGGGSTGPTPIATAPSKIPVSKIPVVDGTIQSGLTEGEKLGYWIPGEKLVLPEVKVPAQVPDVTGTTETAAIGEGSLQNLGQGFQQQILTLREMQNAFETDIYEMMDKVQDRHAVLTNHINLMKLLEAKSKANIQELADQIALLKTNFENVTAQKQSYENQFFADLKTLNPLASEEKLSKFIELSKMQVELKANYNSRVKIQTYHRLLLENLEKRRKDYELNKEPLVKGVKVIDVIGSDINLILQEAE